MAAQPTPFRVRFAPDQVEELRKRLKQARWPDELEGVGWGYGMPKGYLRELAEHWQHGFDFQAAEARLNAFPQFKLRVHSIDVHFIHRRSPHPNAVPLLLSHGWPGSVVEFLQIIPLLTDPEDSGAQAFHVVAPSLPGFGFSSAPTQPGFGIRAMAQTFDALMAALGYGAYVAQGGDWGAAITSALGRLFPGRCRAVHTNMVMAGPTLYNPWRALQPLVTLHLAQLANMSLPVLNRFPLLVSPRELAGFKSLQNFMANESGYFKEQSTKPQTLGYALSDSPLGLLAWIAEKYHRWVDRKGSDTPEPALTRDEMLLNVSLYWFSGNITSSLRIYYEFAAEQRRGEAPSKGYCKVPTGAAIFPGELGVSPRAWVAAGANLVHWREMASGGHFAAWEEPAALAADLRAFFGAHH